jgi:hypothetical protein
MKAISLITLALTLPACGTDEGRVDLGDDELGTTAQTLEDYAGSWDGYVEAFTFGTGSDRLRIDLDENGNGTIEFGDKPAIAPYSDPSLGYPVDEPFSSRDFLPNYAEPREGYAYPVEGAAVAAGRIKFGAWGAAILAEYCAAQTPLVAADTLPLSYTCSPAGFGWGSNGDGTCVDNDNEPVDCGKVKTCIYGCECDASSCQARISESEEILVDGSLTASGTELVGTLLVPTGWSSTQRVTLRLTKQ